MTVAVDPTVWCRVAGLVVGSGGAPLLHRFAYRPATQGSSGAARVPELVLVAAGEAAAATGGLAIGVSSVLPAMLAAVASVAALAVVDVCEQRLPSLMVAASFATTGTLVHGAAGATGSGSGWPARASVRSVRLGCSSWCG